MSTINGMLTIAPSFVEFYCLLSSTNDLFCLRSKKEIGNCYRKSENVSGCCLFSIGFDIQLNDYIYAYKHIYSPTHLLMSNLYSIVPKDHFKEERREVGFFVFPFIQ